MIRKIVCILVSVLIVSIVFSPAGCSQGKTIEAELVDASESSYIPGTYLINTRWGQHGEYKKLCPLEINVSGANVTWNYCRLGCWSVALAQIIRYYQLQSYGYVKYWCTLNALSFPIKVIPSLIKNKLYAHMYDWSLMPYKLTSTSPQDKIEMTRQFVYDVACTIQKDFGTGGYVSLGDTFDVNNLKNELYNHFYDINNLIWVEELTIANITSEIDHFRPIMFYIRNTSELDGTKKYHAVVLDGYQWNVSGKFEVHLNYGWDAGNPDPLNDSWYSYTSQLPFYWDTDFRKGLLFIAEPIPQIFGQITALPRGSCSIQTTTINNAVSTIYYQWDWGDGNFSDWMGRYSSGERCIANHSWVKHGIYSVKVKASDLDKWESPWSRPHKVYIPRLRVFLSMVENLVDLMTRFPRLEPLLQPLLKLICG